jgi:formate hydrogenlyase transcriptional activator
VEESWLRPEFERDAGLRSSISNHQQEIIEAALAHTHGLVAGPHGAAAKLEVPRTTLESKIRSSHVDKKRYRSGNGIFSSKSA